MNVENQNSNVYLKLACYDIIPRNIAFSFSFLATLYLLYKKLVGSLLVSFQVCFIFLSAFYGVKTIFSLVKVLRPSPTERFLKIPNLAKLVHFSDFFRLLLDFSKTCSICLLAQFLDKKNDVYLFYFVYSLVGFGFVNLIYSLLSRASTFHIQPDYSDLENPADEQHLDATAFVSSMVSPLLTYLTSFTIICGGSAGVCSQIYISTITSILGAFGVSLSDLSDYMFPVTVVLLGISVFSLYIKRKKLLHKPFLLGVASSMVIIVGNFLDGFGHYIVYPGNVLMIVAAVWNAKLNKLYGIPKFK